MSRRCTAPGCGRFVRQGEQRCARHRDCADRGPPESGSATDESGSIFLTRLAHGDYRALLDPEIREVIASAGAERGLTGEIGVLRMVLARLILEERDPGKLAQNAARIASVLVQAERAQHTLSGDKTNGLADAVTRILAELEG